MYGIPADLDLSDIVGCDLNQICLGRYDVQFVFDCKVTIVVQSRVSCFEDNKTSALWNQEENWGSIAFQRFVNATVQGYTVIDVKTLEISFAGGLRLHLHDDSDQYESMQIYRAGDPNGPIII